MKLAHEGKSYASYFMIKKLVSYIIFSTILLISFSLNYSFANGGDQRVVEGKYLINLSRSPFTPKAEEKVAMIASFFDIQRDKLIAEDLVVRIRIAKLGDDRERKFIFEKSDVKVKGGILEIQHTFTQVGLHEIFFDFAFASDPEKIYNAPDFLLDIQKGSTQGTPSLPFPLGIAIGGAVLGFVGGWLIRRSSCTSIRS